MGDVVFFVCLLCFLGKSHFKVNLKASLMLPDFLLVYFSLGSIELPQEECESLVSMDLEHRECSVLC